MAQEMQLNDDDGGNESEGSSDDSHQAQIAGLPAEIEQENAEISRLQATSKIEALLGIDEEEDYEDYEPGFTSCSKQLHEALANLISLWEQRLSGSTKSLEVTEGETTTAKSPGAGIAATENGDAALPTTIFTSHQNNISDHTSVASTDVTSNGPSPRRTNLFLENILSPFGGSSGGGKKRHELEKMVRERDLKIEELELVICSNIEIIKKIKDTIDMMDEGKGGDGSNSVSNNIAELKEALMNLSINERGSGSLSVEGGESISKAPSKDAAAGENNEEELQTEISTLQNSVKDLESTVSLQETQNNTLKSEVSRLQQMINKMEVHSSSQEDEIETLKAKVVKLELTSAACKKKTKSVQSHSSHQEDQIETLKAEITKLELRSSLQEEEKRHAMEDLKTELELSHLESSQNGHDDAILGIVRKFERYGSM